MRRCGQYCLPVGACVGASSTTLSTSRGFSTPARPNNSKPNVVVIGTGWAGARFVKGIDTKSCNLTVLSHRNHMVITPLLPQTTTGTLEFRSICEPIVKIQPALAQLPNAFYRTNVHDINFDEKIVQCISAAVTNTPGEAVPTKTFDLHYDKLILAHGAKPNTFGVPGVEDHAFFLREISDSRSIRRRLLQNIMFAKLPTTDVEEKKRLLHVVIVGGGPSGVEFAADLSDFLSQDLPKIDASLRSFFKITIVEAMEVLGTFDKTLRNYGVQRLQKMGVKTRKAGVTNVTHDSVTLSGGEVVPCGLVVWSTGVGPTNLTRQLTCDKGPAGRISVNGGLQVIKDGKPVRDVYAIGDAAIDIKAPLPTIAAVASRHGTYLCNKINKQIKARNTPVLGADGTMINADHGPNFVYKSVGSMASLGQKDALVDLQSPVRKLFMGFKAFVIWRSAYMTMLGSNRARMSILMNWFSAAAFGRDATHLNDMNEAVEWKNVVEQGAVKEQVRRKQVVTDAAKQQEKK